MGKLAKKYKLQGKATADDPFVDCGPTRYDSQEEGEQAAKTARQIAAILGLGDTAQFQCVECDEEELAGAAR